MARASVQSVVTILGLVLVAGYCHAQDWQSYARQPNNAQVAPSPAAPSHTAQSSPAQSPATPVPGAATTTTQTQLVRPATATLEPVPQTESAVAPATITTAVQPAPTHTLQSVPDQQHIQQASYTVQETATAEQATPADPPAEPFLDLSNTDSAKTSASDQANLAAGDNEIFVRLGVWTVIILCLCTLTALGIRHWQRSKGMLPQSNTSARVLESVSLGPNRVVSLVQLRGIQAVVGTDGSGIRTIVLAPPTFAVEMSSLEQDLKVVGQE
jgi:flagellar biogenesis protein FliO